MKSRSYSFSDALFLLASVLVIACIMLIGIQRQRAAARNTSCSNNLKQMALAIHNYHSAYRRMPAGCGGTSPREGSRAHQNNAGRLSGFVGLLPFMEEQAMWERISNPYAVGKTVYPSMGPVPWYDEKSYAPWGQRSEIFVCPSDKDAAKHSKVSSYVMNYGDAVHLVGHPYDQKNVADVRLARATNRGAFTSTALRFRDFLDGLSNTIMFSEVCIARNKVAKDVENLALEPALCTVAHTIATTKHWPVGRDACWADGTLRSSGFQTILPPNSPSATSKENSLEGVISASSHHTAGGAHFAFMDGSVSFALDSIDAGDSHSATVSLVPGEQEKYAAPGSKSPYGLWGSLGTRASAEIIENHNDSIIPPPRELSASEKAGLLSKPKQEWTASNGTSKLLARQIDIQNQSTVLLLDDAGDIKRVPLSKLRSEDAYRAVEQFFAEKIKARKVLRSQLEEGLKMLDNKQYDEFAKRFVPGAELDPKSMGKLVEMDRGLFIHLFTSGIRGIDNPSSQSIHFAEEQNGSMTVEFRARGILVPKLRFMYSNDRWGFGLRN